MTAPVFIGVRDVADMLGLHPTTLTKKLRRLQEEENFPLQAVHDKRRYVFRRAAILRWIDNQSAALDEVDHAAIHPLELPSPAQYHLTQIARQT